MHPDGLEIGEHDLLAYVDDQLPLERRALVAAYLSDHPDEAARVMADLAARDALKATLGSPVSATPAVRGAAARLDRALTGGGTAWQIRRAAAVMLLVGAGWFAHSFLGSTGPSVAAQTPPSFVDDAVHAYRTAIVRAGLPSQPAATSYDRAELNRGTGIPMPDLPRGWRVEDVQVFPADGGQAIEMILDTPDKGRLFLFAAATPRFDVIAPSTTRTEAGATVYWQVGQTAYALSGALPDEEIAREAVQLASSFY